MSKKKKVTFIVLASVLLLLASAVFIYYVCDFHPYFDDVKEAEFKIPGLNEKFVPQGFDFDEASEHYFISGYMADETASRLYLLEEGNEDNYSYVTLTVEGEDHLGHLGGVAVYENNVWVASDKVVYRLNKADILTAENKDKIEVVDCFTPGNGADSITVFEGKLWVGEFYMKDKYETPSAHHLEVKDGEVNRAVAYCYELDESGVCGVASTTPIAGLSLPDKAQGFDFTTDGKIIVSTSYSIPDSHIYIYEDVLENSNKIDVEIDGATIPVYKLYSNNLKKDIKAPSMSEEVVVKDGRLFILFESACSKYKLVNRTRIKEVISITID